MSPYLLEAVLGTNREDQELPPSSSSSPRGWGEGLPPAHHSGQYIATATARSTQGAPGPAAGRTVTTPAPPPHPPRLPAFWPVVSCRRLVPLPPHPLIQLGSLDPVDGVVDLVPQYTMTATAIAGEGPPGTVAGGPATTLAPPLHPPRLPVLRPALPCTCLVSLPLHPLVQPGDSVCCRTARDRGEGRLVNVDRWW